jgi:parvulin-like peptidyl-prolyl isomerase
MSALLALCALALAPQEIVRLKATPESAASSGVVLSIDGNEIRADEYGRWMLDLYSSRQGQRFAEQWLVREAAKERGVELAPGAVDAKIDADIAARIDGAFLGQRDGWLAELERTGWSEGGHREHRRVEDEPYLLASELTRRTRAVPEELIVRDWEHFYGPQGKEYALSGMRFEVALETPADSAPDVVETARRKVFNAALARALDARERALAGEDFATLARTLSEDPQTRASGGRIDAKFRPAGWNAPFVESILALGPGAISQPLYAKGGFWIVKVESVVETPLAAVRDQLAARLVELGPEDFEVAATWKSITQGLRFELTPALFEARSSSERSDPVVGLVINGRPVLRSEFVTWLARDRGEHHVRDFAEHWCVERRANELGVAVSEDEIEARMREFQTLMIDRSYKGSREAWLTYMRRAGRDEAGWRREWARRFRIDLLCEKILLAERVVDDAAVRARFEREYGRDGKRIEARLLLVASANPETTEGMRREELDAAIVAAREAAHAKAEALRVRVVRGEDFEMLARQFSDDEATRATGGRLEGRVQLLEWPAVVGESLLTLAPGALSPVLDVERGFAFFEVLAAQPVSFDTVAAELRRELETERPAQGDLAGVRNLLVQRARIVTHPGVYGK